MRRRGLGGGGVMRGIGRAAASTPRFRCRRIKKLAGVIGQAAGMAAEFSMTQIGNGASSRGRFACVFGVFVFVFVFCLVSHNMAKTREVRSRGKSIKLGESRPCWTYENRFM